MESKRNTTMSIVKGLAIILMVLGHAEAPGQITTFIYLFHMPVFFMASGYFFSRKNVDEPWEFCRKRFKGLYIPFLKWSLFFLLIHNFLFTVGILNEQYGNWSGGITHPYTAHQFLQRLVSIVFAMGGYDEFLAGAFWFFRALLISSIVFLILFKLLEKRDSWFSGWKVAAGIAILAVLFAAFKISNRLSVVNVVQGGIRETWGILFFACGVIYRHFKPKLRLKWWMAVLFFAFLCAGTHFAWAGMNLAPKLQDVFTLPLTGIAGFLMLHIIASAIDKRNNPLKRFLVYAGDMSVYVYIFHISAFKLVSLIKIWWYGLDFGQIGCHMVIHDFHGDLFWILYTIVGTAVPLIWIYLYRKADDKLKQAKLKKAINKN